MVEAMVVAGCDPEAVDVLGRDVATISRIKHTPDGPGPHGAVKRPSRFP